MKATYIIENDDGGYRMSRKVQGRDEKDVLGKGKIPTIRKEANNERK